MATKTWTSEHLGILTKIYPNNSCEAIAKKLGRTPVAIKSKATFLKLRHAPGYNRMRNSAKALTAQEISFVAANYLKYPNHVLAKMMNRSESAIQSCRKKIGINGKENSGRFQKGIVPANKGKKMPPGWATEAMKRTQFKNGQKPHNTKIDGHTSVRYSKGRSYIWIRIKVSTWKQLHRIVWEKIMGPIPPGYNVQFKDRNGLNCDPSNLYITNRQNQILENTIHRYDPELKSLIRLAGKLKRKLSSYEKQN